MSFRVSLLITLLAAPLPALAQDCSPAKGTKEYKALVALDYCKFDQTKDSGRQAIKGPQKCETDLIEDYLKAHRLKLKAMQEAAIKVHLAHAYTMSGDDKKALSMLESIRADSTLPTDFLLFVNAQIDYLQGDSADFEAKRVQLRDLKVVCDKTPACGNEAPRCPPSGRSMFFGAVERLRQCWDYKPRSLKVMLDEDIKCAGPVTVGGL